MQFYGVLTGEGGDGFDFAEGEDGAVEGVFETDYSGGAGVDVGANDGVGFDVGEGEVVVVAGTHGDEHGAGEVADAAGFVFDDVRAVVTQNGVRRGGKVGFERDLVAHCAGHDEEGGFMASEAGDLGFKGVGGGVFHCYVVEEGGVDESIEHAGGGCCCGVRAEVEGGGTGLLPGVDLFVVGSTILETGIK